MNLFNLSLRLNGFPIDEAKTAFNAVKAISETEYEQHIIAQRELIVSHHLENNKFYKKIAPDADKKNWNSIPVITKRHLQQPIENRLSHRFTKKKCHIHKTSGSSGEPFIFAKDKFCHALTWAGFIDRYAWYGIDFKSSRQARFYGIPLDKKGYYKERIKDVLSNRFRFSVFDLSDDQLEKNLKKFKTSAFDHINGYTSAIVQFAKFLNQKGVILKKACPSLNACIITSEMLFEEDKELLESQFGIPVINEYGAAELGLIAFQNTKNEWQVNSEDLFVEILDSNDEVLPYGQEGRVVITSLYNKAHPFIRYDIGDIGILSASSTFKKPILEKLIGRTNDIVVLPSGKKAAGLTFYYVTKTVIEDNANVKEFIIEQLKLDSFKISYVSNEQLSDEKIKHIDTAIERYLEPGLHITFKRKTALKRSKSGKLKQFRSCL